MSSKYKLLLFGLVLISGCNGVSDSVTLTESQPDEIKSPEIQTTLPQGGVISSGSRNVRVQDDTNYAVFPLIPFDGIRPVYIPEFTSSDTTLLLEEELIIGVAWGGEAKAYPITILRFREMVNDELVGIPTLVTW